MAFRRSPTASHIDVICPGRMPLSAKRRRFSFCQLTFDGLQRAGVEAEAVAREGGDLPGWCMLPVTPEQLPHEHFKRLTAQARVMVRTGECTPYANVVLVADQHQHQHQQQD